jgi:hypothetical protein
MSKRALALGAVAGLIVGGVGVAAVRSAAAITQARTFTVVAPDTERVRIDEGMRGASAGDRLIFAGPIRQRQKDVGRIDGVCTTTSNPAGPAERRQLCVITASFNDRDPGSEIEMQGVGRIQAEDVVLGVAGGTGNYANVRGTATFDFRTAGKAVVTFRLIP